jgi:hypothetical protein
MSRILCGAGRYERSEARQDTRAGSLVCLGIQHRVQRLLHRSTNHLAEMGLVSGLHPIWMTWPIGFSSLIGCSFLILEEAVNPDPPVEVIASALSARVRL